MGWPERHVLGAVLRLQPGGWGILESPLRVLSMVSTHKGDVQMQPGLQRTKHHLSGVDTSQTRKGGAGAHGWRSSNAPRSPATFLSFPEFSQGQQGSCKSSGRTPSDVDVVTAAYWWEMSVGNGHIAVHI